MSLQFRITDQLLRTDDHIDKTEAVVNKYDAFLNLLCGENWSFQRDAVREALRFLVSEKYPNLERLARENWESQESLRQRHESLDAFLDKMPLRDRKAVSLDLATGTGKSYVLYGLAAIALAEGLADRVLVLCPSLTIEEGLLGKFTYLAGLPELAAIMKELNAVHAIPGIRRGNETIQMGDICVENIHAVYENTGSSIADSFRGNGVRTLVLNDEAHHLFSPADKSLKEWIKFLLKPDFSFRMIVNVTGTAYVGNDYFPDVIFRYGLKQAIQDKVVKKPNYKMEDTYQAHDWQKTYAFHQNNRNEYASLTIRPLTIIVTSDIALCVEVWRKLVNFLSKKEKISIADAERKAIWVASGIPSAAEAKRRVEAAYGPRGDKDSPEKRRNENLNLLKHVDETSSSVEWIVSVSMLTEGWDVKNVFQIVPHDSRAFSSKLLIAQVLGRGLRIPPGMTQPFVTINNHEAWSEQIANLLVEVLEVENTLSWGYDSRRSQYVFPIHNLRYEPEMKTVQAKRMKTREPDVQFHPQAHKTTEISKFSETGSMEVEIEHSDIYEVDDAVAFIRLFLREKDEKLASLWTKEKLKKFIVKRLKKAGYDSSFLSKENLLRLQQGMSSMLPEEGNGHPRYSQTAKEIVQVDLTSIGKQVFSESSLKEHGRVWHVAEDRAPFGGQEAHLWEQYQRLRKQYLEYGSEASEQSKAIGSRLNLVSTEQFKSPWNIHFTSYEPERKFSDLLFHNAKLFEAFVKMPNQGGYSFPYSYKPSKTGKTHTRNENFNPDFFIRIKDKHDILVVEIKEDDADNNRNRAKCRDGLNHFETLNSRLADAGEPWRYYFFFLSPEDFSKFFDQIPSENYKDWKSGLMQDLAK